MRNYRRKRQGSGKIKKIMFRIIFVLVAALVITIATVLLGHYLQKKVDEVGSTELETEPLGDEISRDEIDTSSLGYNSETVFACGIDITAYESEEDLLNKIVDLASYYDTLNISITDDNGNFIYTSPALCELLRLPEPETNQIHEMIKSAIQSAKTVGMRVCIIMAPSDFYESSSIIVDTAVAREMSDLGADEILFIPELSAGDYINYNIATGIRSYFIELRENVPETTRIGIILPQTAYAKVSNTKQLQMIASAVTFMAIDFSATEESTPDILYSKVSETVASLIDSFRIYNMRVVISGTNQENIGAIYAAAINNSINNISFTSSVIPSELFYKGNDSDSDNDTENENETLSEKDRTNPYAVTSPSEEESESSNRPWY